MMKLSDWLLFYQNSNNDEIKQHLKLNPVEVLINSLPHSLIVLDTIYSRFSICSSEQFPSSLLKPDKLVRQLVWWFTKDSDHKSPDVSPISEIQEQNDWKMAKPKIKNLLRIIFKYHPQLLTSLKQEQRQLFVSLESLGLHGMINFGDRALIDITEAVRQELMNHQYRLKSHCQTMEKVIQAYAKEDEKHFVYSLNGFQGPAPTISSHQRLMGLRLSEIKNRLQCNENLLQLLQNCLRNSDLEGLGEILLKRINYDQDILAQLNYLIRSNTCIQFTVAEDPIVSQILVLFSKGYEKLLKIIPDATASDDEVPSLSTCSSCSVAESAKYELNGQQADREKKYAATCSAINSNLVSSAADDNNTKGLTRGANLFYNKREQTLLNSEKMPDQNYDTKMLLSEYNHLATVDRISTLKELDSLPDLANASELRQKILFFVIVVAFRAVRDSLQTTTENVWRCLQSEPPDDRDLMDVAGNLHFALLTYLKQKAYKDNYETTFRIVINQIQITLSEFSCLKSCEIFISFIRKCVKVAWTLHTTKPGYKLEYKETQFDPKSHRRCESSNFSSSIIKQFLWPGLVENLNKSVAYPAIVCT